MFDALVTGAFLVAILLLMGVLRYLDVIFWVIWVAFTDEHHIEGPFFVVLAETVWCASHGICPQHLLRLAPSSALCYECRLEDSRRVVEASLRSERNERAEKEKRLAHVQHIRDRRAGCSC